MRCSSSTSQSTTTSTPTTRSVPRPVGCGIDPREYAYDVQLQREGRQLIYTPLFNFVDGNLDAVREMITIPVSMFGLSDGGAHCGAICDASMTTSYMTLWARDRGRRDCEFLSSPSCTIDSSPADTFGWLDRGLVAARTTRRPQHHRLLDARL